MKSYSNFLTEINLRKAISYPACSLQSTAHIIGKSIDYVRKKYEDEVMASSYAGLPDLIISKSNMLKIIEAEGFTATKEKKLKYQDNNKLLNFGDTIKYFKDKGNYLVFSRPKKISLGYHVVSIKNGQVVDTSKVFNLSLAHFDDVEEIYSIR